MWGRALRDDTKNVCVADWISPYFFNEFLAFIVLIRNRFHAVAVAGDLRKAFLQVRIRIREAERDELWFHWIVDKHFKEVETPRFTRVLFGLAPSPFLLGGYSSGIKGPGRLAFQRALPGYWCACDTSSKPVEMQSQRDFYQQ